MKVWLEIVKYEVQILAVWAPRGLDTLGCTISSPRAAEANNLNRFRPLDLLYAAVICETN